MAKEEEADMFEHMVPIAEFENEFEAEIACGHLKSQGIDAIVLKDDAGGMFPSLQETEGVRLLAPQEQAEMARRVLEERNCGSRSKANRAP